MTKCVGNLSIITTGDKTTKEIKHTSACYVEL